MPVSVFSTILLLWSPLLVFISSATTLRAPIDERAINNTSAPLPPSQDPWYTAPPNYASASPGDILRIRHAPGNLSSVMGNCSEVYNILYRTTSALYLPSWAVTTLYIPSKSNNITGNYLLSYQYPYDSPNIDNSPSYFFYSNPYSDVSISLGLGWYVLVPDFEGPLASVFLGAQDGYAIIDSIRAALSSTPVTSLSSNNTKYAMWGYATGSTASEWAAELAAQYAPELSFAGAALGGLLTNVTSVLETVNGGFFSSIIPRIVLGAVSQYPDAKEFLLSKLNATGPYNSSTFFEIAQLQVFESYAVSSYVNWYNYFTDGAADLFAPILQTIYSNQGIVGYHGIPQMPLFVYKSINDELSEIGDTDRAVERYCGVGASIIYERNEVGGFYDDLTNGHGRAVNWLQSVFAQKEMGGGCQTTNVTIGIANTGL